MCRLKVESAARVEYASESSEQNDSHVRSWIFVCLCIFLGVGEIL